MNNKRKNPQPKTIVLLQEISKQRRERGLECVLNWVDIQSACASRGHYVVRVDRGEYIKGKDN